MADREDIAHIIVAIIVGVIVVALGWFILNFMTTHPQETILNAFLLLLVIVGLAAILLFIRHFWPTL